MEIFDIRPAIESADRVDGRVEERARLRPLLERCLIAATTAGIDLELAADIRREIGKE